MPPLPDESRLRLCNELPTADGIDHEQVLSDRCSLATVPTTAQLQSDNMAPKKKKMRRSAQKMSMTAAANRKKTVHFCEDSVDDDSVELVVEAETGDIFSSMDYLFTTNNSNNTDDEVDTEQHRVQCDSEIEAEESESEADEAASSSSTTGDELQQLFAVYRLEVEQLVRSSASMENEVTIQAEEHRQ